MEKKPSVGLVLLAAGSSSRLGQAKQLLKYNKRPLIRVMARNALRSLCFPIQVVLGANFFRILKKVEDMPVYIDVNENWEKGMGNSLSFGLKKILNVLPSIDAVIFMVCDQPHVTSKVVNDLILKYMQTDANIVGCRYNDIIGVPALFDKTLFSELLKLDSEQGAGKIIKQHDQSKVEELQFEKGSIDIDTYEDYFNEILKFES